MEYLPTIIVSAVILLILGAIVYSGIKKRKNGGCGCSCGCGGCSGCSHAENKESTNK